MQYVLFVLLVCQGQINISELNYIFSNMIIRSPELLSIVTGILISDFWKLLANPGGMTTLFLASVFISMHTVGEKAERCSVIFNRCS